MLYKNGLVFLFVRKKLSKNTIRKNVIHLAISCVNPRVGRAMFMHTMYIILYYANNLKIPILVWYVLYTHIMCGMTLTSFPVTAIRCTYKFSARVVYFVGSVLINKLTTIMNDRGDLSHVCASPFFGRPCPCSIECGTSLSDDGLRRICFLFTGSCVVLFIGAANTIYH